MKNILQPLQREERCEAHNNVAFIQGIDLLIYNIYSSQTRLSISISYYAGLCGTSQLPANNYKFHIRLLLYPRLKAVFSRCDDDAKDQNIRDHLVCT